MLDERILATFKFFDLQATPLTLLELHKFLLTEPKNLENLWTPRFELKNIDLPKEEFVSVGGLFTALTDLVKRDLLVQYEGYYALPGRLALINERLNSYGEAIKSERRIARYLPSLKYLPFIRGVAVGGSQALGRVRPESDIDLFIITESNRIWLARVFITIYFQLFLVRRHGQKIAKRFCLNHYVAGDKILTSDLNVYTAMEYGRLRQVVHKSVIDDFKDNNLNWISKVFPQMGYYCHLFHTEAYLPKCTKLMERVFNKYLFADKLEKILGAWQLKRIKQDELILIAKDELSFHHAGKQKQLLGVFYSYLVAKLRLKLEIRN